MTRHPQNTKTCNLATHHWLVGPHFPWALSGSRDPAWTNQNLKCVGMKSSKKFTKGWNNLIRSEITFKAMYRHMTWYNMPCMRCIIVSTAHDCCLDTDFKHLSGRGTGTNNNKSIKDKALDALHLRRSSCQCVNPPQILYHLRRCPMFYLHLETLGWFSRLLHTTQLQDCLLWYPTMTTGTQECPNQSCIDWDCGTCGWIPSKVGE